VPDTGPNQKKALPNDGWRLSLIFKERWEKSFPPGPYANSKIPRKMGCSDAYGIRTKMRVKLAAKMLVTAWTLMKKGEPFNPDYLNVQ
jgi:hypothetical protein